MQHWKRLVALGLFALLAACGGGGGGGGGGEAGGTGGPGPAPTAEGAGGGGGADGPITTPPAPEAATNRLFVSTLSSAGQNIALFGTPVPDSSQIRSSEVLSVPVVAFELAVAYDTRRDLLYSHFADEIVIYANAKSLRSGAQPTRRIALPAQTHHVHGLQLNAQQDVLYVALWFNGSGQLLVYERASTLASGAAPTRTFPLRRSPESLSIDTVRRIAYWTDGLSGGIHEFSLDTGPLVEGLLPTRFPLGNVRIAIDAARDRLYAAGNGAVHVIDGASTAQPRLSRVPVADAQNVDFDESSDRLYVGALERAYIFERASLLGSTSASPAVVVQGPSGVWILGFAFAP